MASFAERLAGKVAARLAQRRGHACVVAFWCAVAVCGAVLGPRLLQDVVMEFEPPKGSKSAEATLAFREAFPAQADTAVSILYIESPVDAPDLLAPLAPGGDLANSTLCRITDRALRHFAAGGPRGDLRLSVTGLCTLDARLRRVAAGLVAMNGHASIVRFEGSRGSKEARAAGQAIIGLVADLREDYPDLFVGPFGQQTLGVEAMDGLSADLEKMDMTIPLAAVVMAFMVQSLRLMLLPLLCLGVSFSTAVLGVYTVSQLGMAINSAAPTLMAAILVALSIDYALFLLTRFSEEMLGGAETVDAVAVMLARSGKTIVGSGFTLCLCFVGLLAFPVSILQSVGVAIIAAVLATMAVNLTLMPACLLACPGFFARKPSACCAARSRPVVEATGRAPGGASLLAGGFDAAPKLPPWYRLARAATSRCAWPLALVVLLSVLVPGCVMMARMQHSGSTLLMVPRTGDTPTTLKRLERAFPAGIDSPYDLLLQPKTGGSVYEEQFFQESRRLLARLAVLAGAGSQVTSPMWATGSPGNNVSFSALRPLLEARTDAVCNALPAVLASQCLGLRYLANSTVNADRTAIVASVVINHPMGSPEASEFTRLARQAMEDFAPTASRVGARLAGAGPVYADGVDVVYTLMPIVLGVTLVVVLAIVGVLYRSVGIAVRALLTIAFTIAFSFGVGMGIYQYGWLDGLGISRLGRDGAFAWLVPPVAFSVVLGLALDYDIFLVGRVVEFRLAGFGDREAVQLGLWKTGKVITAAGLIMAIAFAGLMFSNTAMLNQSSAMLVSAVLVDTFVVRSLVVPAVMGVMGWGNWWPLRVPAGDRNAEDYVRWQVTLLRGGGANDCGAPSELPSDLGT